MFYPITPVNKQVLPEKFTYPFHYEAHPLCDFAAKELQKMLLNWGWGKDGLGKMFGVLLVQDAKGNVGYLFAYSGNLNDKLDSKVFVPPIYDLLDENSFFYKGEQALNAINETINELEGSEIIRKAKRTLKQAQGDLEHKLIAAKEDSKHAKLERKRNREEANQTLNEADVIRLNNRLIQESQRGKSAIKQLKIGLQKKVEEAEKKLEAINQPIIKLKQERKTKSALLQERLFKHYQLLDAKGELKDLVSVFRAFNGKEAPASAGDCALPRLLQHAYINEMKPLAMAEFWWGKSPNTVLRKAGNYYPSCRGKCEPILSHMLQGLTVDNNPLVVPFNSSIEIIFEDEVLLGINKPSGMLSVPGKLNQPNVLDYLVTLRPELTSLMLVHRLDMATSGVLLIAKDEKTYKNLQKQFLRREVKKRYEALLDGSVDARYGKIELPLRVDLQNRPQQMVCYEHGKPAITTWKVLDVKGDCTRIAFYPITGRTHQLRVHAAHVDGLNTPIVGDELYGSKAKRLMLHAASIEFKHPVNKKIVRLACKVPF